MEPWLTEMRLIKSLILFLILSWQTNKAQIIYFNNYDYDKKQQFIIQSNNELGTNTLPINVIKKYFNNDSLSKADKQFIKADTLLSPSIGFENQYGFQYLFKPDSIFHHYNPWQFLLSADQNNAVSIVTTRDIALNVLNGNSSYVKSEQKIKLSPAGYTQLKYQRVGVGIHRNYLRDSSNIQIYIKGNFINLQKYSEAQFSSSFVSFDDTSYEATGSIHLLYNRGMNSNAYFGAAGKGFSIDAGVTYKTETSCISATISNVGRIYLSNVKSLQVDSNFVFKGYQVDFNRLVNDSNYRITTDSLFNVKQHTKTINTNIASPYTIRLNAQNHFFHYKILSVVDVSFKNLKSFTPRILISEFYQFNEKVNAGVYFASGGFTKWQYGLAANLSTEKYLIRLQIQNPHVGFTKKSLANAGVFVTMGYRLN